ncbi:MAG: methyltransferase [Gammaproteobacteria bacterium]|jgi:predicted methyltransferase|nr:methyltransferase [Gammaproteobacteria bacterium]|tara:strand:- start:1411 stop:2253 length:843 start_codon:yes stop_codon:yes gene_type:complete
MIKIAKFSPVAMVLVALTSINVSSTAYAQEGSMSEVLSHERRDGNRARDEWRHPSRTLSFFGVEPGMTVAEVLPGSGGWYTQILNPLTAQGGRLIGLTYPDSLWSQMFNTWDDDARERNGAHIEQMDRYLSVAGVSPAQPIVGYTIDSVPDRENGQADAVLFFRAMHHLFRFDEPLIDTALSEVYDLLASGGVAGVVQHRAPESAAADFASGNNGYVKQSAVVAAFERAGFVLEASSEMNANENDSADGFVWRLPPTRRDNPETLAIGESDRMTLRFRKP